MSDNSLGFITGERIRYGANSVLPNPSTGALTTGIARTTNTATGATVNRSMTFSGDTASPDLYAGTILYSPNLRGPWTLSFTNGGDTTSVTRTIPAAANQAPFVNNITITGSGAQPTFTWQPPAGVAVDGYRVNIYDRDETNAAGRADLIISQNQLANTFTAPTLNPAHNYSIEISLLQKRDPANPSLNNPNIAAMSRVYADFVPLPTGSPAVNLPISKVDGSFEFDISVTPGVTYYIDPVIATGYEYKIGAGDPNFASVTLPDLQASPYHLQYLLGGALQDLLLAGGVEHLFPAGGIDMFTVLGIETALMLDPANPTAFITGLTFAGAGAFTGTQTPITVTVGVPEPSTWAIMLIGFAGLGVIAYRKRAQPAAA